FHFFGIPDFGLGKLSIAGGSGSVPVTFNQAGTVTFNPGDLDFFLSTTEVLNPDDGCNGNSQDLLVELTSTSSAILSVDFALPTPSPAILSWDFPHRTFAFTGSLTLGNASGSFTAVGTITSFPPTAVATTEPSGPIECTSPSGAPVTLDASGSSSPDNDLVQF